MPPLRTWPAGRRESGARGAAQAPAEAAVRTVSGFADRTPDAPAPLPADPIPRPGALAFGATRGRPPDGAA